MRRRKTVVVMRKINNKGLLFIVCVCVCTQLFDQTLIRIVSRM